MKTRPGFDRTNAIIAGIVFLVSFIVYAMTVQRSISFWDCGEFIACAYTLGIPHPPGTPLLMVLGRVLSLIPFVEDISYRINYISVISSPLTAMFSYLLTVRLVTYFFNSAENRRLSRVMAYVGGVTGAFFVAFSNTNWANSVEAEAYGLALALSAAILWLTVRYFEERGTPRANRTMILVMYLAMLGVGVHLTVFLVVPICAIFFILKRSATARDYFMICGWATLELLMVIVLSYTANGAGLFKLLTVIFGLLLFTFLYKRVKWGILIAIATVSTVMMSFDLYLKATVAGIVAMLILALLSGQYQWKVQWKSGLALIAAGILGFSMHLYIPIRSSHNPRIDENNPSRSFATFINFLDRKQYGQTSMVDRMFHRRGLWKNQLGRHPHMGFWSYFEGQYSREGWPFVPFFLLGLLGMFVAIRKRAEIGVPFFTLFLLASLGLILYMNFADGTQYNFRTNDAYLEVRNRDYFFTPAFVFFGIAMGMGVTALIGFVKNFLARNNPGLQKTIVYASVALVLLPLVSLAKNYHINDRSKNFIPYLYSKDILDSCPPDAILFTSGDNDTFPVWCVQEVYNYRKDVRVVNLSLLNTDWYVEQMKNRYNVPISLSDEQILWYPFSLPTGETASRPRKPFYDRPRKRQTYLWPSPYGGRIVKVQDMMMDEIVLENKWQVPICFSAPPYAESPLKLRDRISLTGLVYTLQRESNPPPVDIERSYDLFMNTFAYDGYQDSQVYRDENATGVFLGVGVSGTRLADELLRSGDTTRAIALLDKMHTVYPEYWQSALTLSDIATKRGDSAQALRYIEETRDTLQAFYQSNYENIFYLQDLGLMNASLGRRLNDQELIDKGISELWAAFEENPNNNYGFRKLVTVLNQQRRYSDMQRAAKMFAEYKMNQGDPLYQQLMQMFGRPSAPQTPSAPPGG